jgi:hypothetical protein
MEIDFMTHCHVVLYLVAIIIIIRDLSEDEVLKLLELLADKTADATEEVCTNYCVCFFLL